MSESLNNLFNSLFLETNFLFGNPEIYPPYNAWFEKDGTCKIELSVSGFSREEISLEFDGKILTIKGERQEKETDIEDRQWIKRGLAKRNFVRKLEPRGSFVLDSAVLRNGLLLITLKRVIQKFTIDIKEV